MDVGSARSAENGIARGVAGDRPQAVTMAY